MAMHDLIKSSYDSLKSMTSSVEALVHLASTMDDGDPATSLLRILAERIESDSNWVGNQTRQIWKYVPEVPDVEVASLPGDEG